MNTIKNGVPHMASATPRREGNKSKVIARLIGLAMEIPPVAYVALTGQAPTWIRVWLLAWLTLWLVVVTVQAVNAQVSEAGR